MYYLEVGSNAYKEKCYIAEWHKILRELSWFTNHSVLI